METDDPVLKTEHQVLFGGIIALFARIEYQMQMAFAGLLQIDFVAASIMTTDSHYSQKRNTLKSLNNVIGIDGHVSAELNDILDDLHKISKLRNFIAHALWTSGKRPDSIKPMGILGIRSGKPKHMGSHHNERDYTIGELQEAADDLRQLSRRFAKFLSESGLKARAEAMNETTKFVTSSSPGIPPSK